MKTFGGSEGLPQDLLLFESEDFGRPFHKLEKVHKTSTDRIEIFGHTTIERLLSNENKLIGENLYLNKIKLSNS